MMTSPSRADAQQIVGAIAAEIQEATSIGNTQKTKGTAGEISSVLKIANLTVIPFEPDGISTRVNGDSFIWVR